MRRFCISLAVLFGLLLALQPVFAQETEKQSVFEVSGTMTTGIFVHFTDMIDKGPFIQVLGEEGVPVLFEFKTRFSTPSGNAGLRFNIEASTGDITVDKHQNASISRYINFPTAYGWLKAFKGILTVYGGYWDPEIYETMGPLESDLGMKNTGMIIQVQPIPGLTLAPSVWAKMGDSTLLKEGKYMFSASYEFRDMFKVLVNYAHYQFDNEGFTDEDNPSTYREQASKDHRINFSFNYTGLKEIAGLTKMALDFEMRDLGGGRRFYQDTGFSPDFVPVGDVIRPLYLGQWIQWQHTGITLNLKASQLFLIGAGNYDNYAPSLRFELSGSYIIDDIFVPKAGVGFYLHSRVWDKGASDLRFGEKANWEDCKKDLMGLGARIGCEFRFLRIPSNLLELGYSLKIDLSKDAEATPAWSTYDHGFYAMLKVSL